MPRENRPPGDPRTRVYNSAAWKRTRAIVLERDDYRCRQCHKAANSVHHIRALEDGGDAFNPDNCLTLCHACHGEIDGVRTSAAKQSRKPLPNRFMHTVTTK